MVVVIVRVVKIHGLSVVSGVGDLGAAKCLSPFGITLCQQVSNLTVGESGVSLGLNTISGGCAIYLIAVCKGCAAALLFHQLLQRIAVLGAACSFFLEQGCFFRSVAVGNSAAVCLGQVTARYADGV